MKIRFTPLAWQDFLHWQSTDWEKLRHIKSLANEACRTPSKGIGKPEPLKLTLAGYWSRRIDREHRLVYKVEGETLTIIQCRYHY
jgi:toxin YoeB